MWVCACPILFRCEASSWGKGAVRRGKQPRRQQEAKPKSWRREKEERERDGLCCFTHGPRKMAASFQRPQIIGRGFPFGLSRGHKQRLAACQAGLKQFQFPDLYTSRKEGSLLFSPTRPVEQNVIYRSMEGISEER